MKYAVNPEGVSSLKRLSQNLNDNSEKISKSTDSLQDTYEENSANLGPHSNTIAQIIEEIKQTASEASGPVTELSDRVSEIAEAYQDIIDTPLNVNRSGN
jgi:methyl-accepting chemotaxis protein